MNPERFARTFDVLELLSDHPGGLRVSEISQLLDTPISSAHNLLRTMVEAQVVGEREGRRYVVGPRAVRHAIRIMASIEARTFGKQHLADLARKIRHDVYLSIRIGDQVMYSDRFKGAADVTVEVPIGRPLYLHSTAVGKLFAAYEPDLRTSILDGRELRKLTDHTITDAGALAQELDAIRQREVSISMSESIEGIAGFAVPVRNSENRLSAAIHVSMLQASIGEMNELVTEARAVAATIEREIGWNVGTTSEQFGAAHG